MKKQKIVKPKEKNPEKEIVARPYLPGPPPNRKALPLIFILSLLAGAVVFFFTKSIPQSAIVFAISFILFLAYFILTRRLKKAADIKRMEEVFPDFISLMASNLRAGMTVDRALLLSSRKEFAPLDKEIIILGKDIVTGKEISQALLETANRIKSEKITKTIRLIISGIVSGG